MTDRTTRIKEPKSHYVTGEEWHHFHSFEVDTWKEPGQKKHIKDPTKHDFKRYSTDVSFWETACTGARAQTQGWSFTFKPEESTDSITTNCFHNELPEIYLASASFLLIE